MKDSAGTVLAVSGWLSLRVAARDASAASRPCRRRHGGVWTPGKRDGSHRSLRLYGLVAQTVRCRDRPARLRGLAPAGGDRLLPHCRRIAALTLLAGGPCRRPVVACLRSACPPWPAGESVFRAGRRRARRRIARFALARMSPRRSRARVPRFRRRCAVPLVVAKTGRSNVAAPVGAGV